MERSNIKAWEGVFEMPVSSRSQKPRTEGVTMVIDKGLGIAQTGDLISTACDYIDVIKLTFGTSAFFAFDPLREKVSLITEAGIDVMPGGTFLEVSVWQGSYDRYLARARELGFTVIEVSDGTITMDDDTRAGVIKRALDGGFRVISEVGKKDPSEAISIPEMHRQIRNDLELGVFKVIMEARESGKGVGIYDSVGVPKENDVDEIVSAVGDVNDLIWEAPIKAQQQYLILRFGVNVNLGNVPPEDVLALEALRCGLRGDTLKRAIEEERS